MALHLQRQGAITFDFVHGVAGSSCGYLPSPASVRCVWLKSEAELYAGSGQQIAASGMPRYALVTRKAERRRAANVLIMSSYAHRDTRHHGWFTHLPFQAEILRVVDLIGERFPGRFRFRWRPHPADDPQEVRKTHSSLPGVELSSRGPLGEDVGWADVLISGFSSAVFESLTAAVPIFLHLIPDTGALTSVQCFDQSRTFFWAEEIVAPFVDCIRLLDAGDASATEAERRERISVFGNGRDPVDAQDYFIQAMRFEAGVTGSVMAD